MSVVRHMFYGWLEMQKSMVTFISKFDPRKGHFQVKLGQISKFKILLQKHAQFFLIIPKMCFIFMYVNQKCQKLCLKKSDVITFSWFFDQCTAKNKDIALKFGMFICVHTCMQLYNVYSVFWIPPRSYILQTFI